MQLRNWEEAFRFAAAEAAVMARETGRHRKDGEESAVANPRESHEVGRRFFRPDALRPRPSHPPLVRKRRYVDGATLSTC